MTTNHILIGLGGTGAKVLAAFRRSIFELEGRKDPEGENVEYLYVDSSPEYMKREHDLWRIPGGDIYPGESSQLNIQGQSLGRILEDISRYPNIKPWIGEVERWSHIQAAISEGIGGQKRRLGRFLFACQASAFVRKLQAQYNACKERTKAVNVVFHVVAGLAGGTGSGSLVDAIALIRKNFPQHRTNRILGYLLLPERNPDPGWCKPGSAYHANGYAALMELNALAVEDYKPFDLTGTGNRIERSGDVKEAPPFDGCFVFVNENEAGTVIDLSKTGEFYKVVGGFLYQKVVAVAESDWESRLARYETMENMTEDPSESEGGRPVRSRRFITFGIKRVVVPDREIREFLVYKAAEQALLQSLHNHVTDEGYADRPEITGPMPESKWEELLASWKASPSCLLQETPILPLPEGSPEYKTYRQEWNITDKIVAHVMEHEKRPEVWMAAVNENCLAYINQNFRAVGIAEFFKVRSKQVNEQARAVLHAVESDLFTRWANGKLSLEETAGIVRKFSEWLGTQRGEFARKAERCREALGTAGGRAELDACIEANTKEWSKIGPLSARFGKREELLRAQARLLFEKGRLLTLLAACEHAEKLGAVLASRLADLQNAIDAVIALHREVLGGSGGSKGVFFGVRNQIESRCRIDERWQPGDAVIKFYKPSEVHDFARRMFTDKEICADFARIFREQIGSRIKNEPGFFSMHQRIDRAKMLDALTDGAFEENVRTKHAVVAAREPGLEPVLDRNIVDLLAREFAGRETETGDFCKNLIQFSGTFLNWNPGQRGASGSNLEKEKDSFETAIVIPQSPNSTDFRAALDRAFGVACGNKDTFKSIEGRRPQEIVLISLRNMFPLRYTRQVVDLKGFYEEYLRNQPGGERRERALMELHSESREYPPLFPPGAGERESLFLPVLLAGRAAGQVFSERDPSTGREVVAWKPAGRPAEILGASIEDALAKSTDDSLHHLRNEFREKLRAAQAAERSQWAEAIRAEIRNLDSQYESKLDEKRRTREAALAKALELVEKPS